MCPSLRGKANTFGDRSNGPMRARRWASPIGGSCCPPFRQGSGPAPSHARWRRAADWRPRLRWAEVDSPSRSLSGRRAPRAQRTGAGRGQGHLRSRTASPRPACAAPPGPGPIPTVSSPGSDSLPGRGARHEVSKPRAPLQPGPLHLGDVWLLSSQTARLPSWDSRTGTWIPVPPLRPTHL